MARRRESPIAAAHSVGLQLPELQPKMLQIVVTRPLGWCRQFDSAEIDMNKAGIDDFMSDPLFGYRHDNFTSVPLNVALDDYENICIIANEIEAVIDPYEASRMAVSLTKQHKLTRIMKVISPSSFKSDTITDNRFKQLENRVVLGVERMNDSGVMCCTPACEHVAIRRSHSLQKKGVLEAISNEENKVYQTKITAFSGQNFMQDVGWNNASTFPGFCSHCEQTVFLAAESRGAVLNEANVRILIWRALCYTRFRRAREVQMRGHIVSKPEAYDLSKNLDDELVIVSSALLFKNRIHSYNMVNAWIKHLERTSDTQKTHSYVAIRVPSLPFVGAGIVPLYFDFDRKRVQISDRFDLDIQSIAYTTCILGGAVHIIMCANNKHDVAIRFLKDMMRMDKYLLSSFLPQIIIGSSDTVYFSKIYWDRQATLLDKHIVKHAYFMNFSQMVFPFWGAMSGVAVETVKAL